MGTITDEFRVYPLPAETEHHNLIQLNPEGAGERAANHRSFGVASDAYLNELQEQVDELMRGAKIRATIREATSPGPAVFDGEIEQLDDESVYIDYCVLSALPESLQPLSTEVTETEFPRGAVFDERNQENGPGVFVELTADSHEEMVEYRSVTNTPRGSTHDLMELYENMTADDRR